MKWPNLRPEEGSVAWGGFVWILPMLYVFWDPYRTGAGWIEWTVTGLGFAAFLYLYAFALAASRDARVMSRVAVGVAVLAVTFTAYRPAGALYFAVAAACGPYGVRGSVPKSLAIITSLLGTLVLEWWLLWPLDSQIPYVVAINVVLVGMGTTVTARQMIALQRAHQATERERIARDLHDILGHTLSVVTLRAELAGRLVDSDPERARVEIEAIEGISRDALKEVREAISGYRSGDLAMEAERARSALAVAGIEADVRVEADGMSVALERVLGMAMREAVTNVLRHAGAKRCDVRVRKEEGMVRLEVQDDGHGGAHVPGTGMSGIRERVEALGGRAAWSTARGTALTITIPTTP